MSAAAAIDKVDKSVTIMDSNVPQRRIQSFISLNPSEESKQNATQNVRMIYHLPTDCKSTKEQPLIRVVAMTAMWPPQHSSDARNDPQQMIDWDLTRVPFHGAWEHREVEVPYLFWEGELSYRDGLCLTDFQPSTSTCCDQCNYVTND
jgi:hypothetical protein